VTPWVTGVSEADGGSGDPSPVTAYGVQCAMRAAAKERWGDPSLRDRRIVVQGAGHVGSRLARLLVDAGASVAVADVDAARVDLLVRELGVEPIAADAAVLDRCDILAPCALGGVVNAETVNELECEIVCGGANNQLASEEMDEALAARGILYAPDFVVNAGGILNIAEEFTGYSHDRAIASTARIEGTVARVFEIAREQRIPPGRAAVELARTRLAEEALPAGRWEPGDPAAWTAGQPLTHLRPTS
jgi:valine dehydrogenase (NAD+)